MCARLGLISKRLKILVLGLSVWYIYERYEEMGRTITKYQSGWSHSDYFHHIRPTFTQLILGILFLNRLIH